MINLEAERRVAEAKGHLDEQGLLTTKAMTVLEDFDMFLVKTKKKVTADVLGDDFLLNINDFREIFPKGFLPHGEIARQSVEELKNKFIWFFRTYPKYDWPLVLEATNYYCYLKDKEGRNYMMTSSNFIQKTDNKTKTVKSGLADYCQLLIDEPEVLTR